MTFVRMLKSRVTPWIPACAGMTESLQGLSQQKPAKSLLWILLCLSAMWLTGCEQTTPVQTQIETPPSPWQGLESRLPQVRLAAIKQAGESGDWRAVPLLVDRLQEEDIVVRMFAARALRLITDRDYGYDFKAPLSERRQAVQRWREALEVGAHCSVVGAS